MINKPISFTAIIISLTASILLSLTFPAYAAKMLEERLEECQKPKLSTKEASRCLDAVIKVVDRELQIWVNNHTLNLKEKALTTGRYSSLNMFKRSQQNFITFRDHDCRWQYLVAPHQKQANIAYKKCYILLSQTRIKELESIP